MVRSVIAARGGIYIKRRAVFQVIHAKEAIAPCRCAAAICNYCHVSITKVDDRVDGTG